MFAESQYFSPGLGSLMSPVNMRRIGNSARMRALLGNNVAAGNMMTITGGEVAGLHAGGGGVETMRRVASSSSLSNLSKWLGGLQCVCCLDTNFNCLFLVNVFIPPAAVGLPSTIAPVAQPPLNASPSSSSGPSSISGIYNRVYASLVCLERDPHPGVCILARTVLEYIRGKALVKSQQMNVSKSFVARELESSGESKPGTPTGRGGSLGGGSGVVVVTPCSITPIVATKFIDWCWCQFSRPSGGMGGLSGGGVVEECGDKQDPSVCTRSWVYTRNANVRRDCFKRVKTFPGKIEEQVVGKNLGEVLRGGGGTVVRFHPYEVSWGLIELICF